MIRALQVKKVWFFAANIYVVLFVNYATDRVACGASHDHQIRSIPESYNPLERPNENGSEPLRINATLWLEAIGKIDVSSMEMEVIGYLSQEWHDPRLHGHVDHNLILSNSKVVWTPDIYCVNCRKSSIENKDGGQRSLIRVEPSGNVYYSIGVNLVSSCYMQLHKFPFDDQTCQLEFLSYSYNMSYVIYEWDSPVVLEFKELAQFEVDQISTGSQVVDYKTGNFSKLVAKIKFVRRVGYYIVQVYMPTGMLVCLSWILFFMHPNHIGDRLAIGITLILTMIFLLGYINGSLPKVSYIKSVDWYLFGSLAMIILSVIECVVIYWLFHRMGGEKSVDGHDPQKDTSSDSKHRRRKQRSLRMSSMRSRDSPGAPIVAHLIQTVHNESKEPWLPLPVIRDGTNACQDNLPCSETETMLPSSKHKSTWPLYRQLDVYCRILFPLTYFILNFLYWYKF